MTATDRARRQSTTDQAGRPARIEAVTRDLRAGYVCGSRGNEGKCATCPKWCRGRAEFDRTTPRWALETKETP